MSHKRAVLLSSETVDIPDSLSLENVQVETIEEYKTLNEKCDQVIIKIKSRKARKKTKK